VGNHVAPGGRATAHYDHYSLLRTVELGLGLDSLGAADANASAVTGIWE
jgi:hypothetical protein